MERSNPLKWRRRRQQEAWERSVVRRIHRENVEHVHRQIAEMFERTMSDFSARTAKALRENR